MPLLLLVAFIGVPILEIALLIEVGGIIGLWPTLGLILLTAVIGSWQLRTQGLATLARARTQLDAGNMPARELFDGFCLVIAGALLLTPGFVTDAVGFLLFLQPLRDAMRLWLGKRLQAHAETHVWVDGQEVHRHRHGPGGPRGPGAPGGPGSRDGVIEAEFEEVTPDGAQPPDPGARNDRLGPPER